LGRVAIGIYKPPDVRAILKAYEGKSIPLEYSKKEADNKRAFVEEWKARGGGKVNRSILWLCMCGVTFLAGFEQRWLYRQFSLLGRLREGQQCSTFPLIVSSCPPFSRISRMRLRFP